MKRLLLILALIFIFVLPVFALSGTYTTNEFFYMPGYGSYGAGEFAEYNAYMEIADNAIKANETASTDENIQDVAGAMFSSNTETGLTVTYQDTDGTIDVVIGANDIVESMLKVVNTPNDEEIFTYESTTGDFEWHTLAELSIQPLDAGLTSIASLTTSANDMIYTTALDTYAIMDTFAELQAVVADKTLINEEDAITLDSVLTIAVTAEPALSISMTDITGTDNQAIDITGGEALGAEEHWTAIRVKPDDLDPSGANTRIRGLAINLSGVDTTNIPDNLCGIRIIMPSGLSGLARDNTEALYISEGDIEHIFTVPNTVASYYTAYDMVLDATLLVSTSAIHAFDFVVAGGDPSGDVCAITTHTYVSPICQLIGSYSTPSQTEYAGEKTGGGSSWVDGIDGSEIFVVNSDEIYVGSTSQFSEIEVIFGTAATKTISPTFWYNTAADTWTQFGPTDATNGFQNGGLISWDLAGITALWTNDGDPGGANASTGYWIKIIRTAAPDPGTPTPTTVKIGTVTQYEWDESGDLTINDIDADYILSSHTGAKGIEITGANTTAQLYIGGTNILANGEQAIYVNCPSEDGATNAMWLTLGSTVVTGDLTGARIKVTTNAVSGGGAASGVNVRGVYSQAIGAAGDDAGLLQGGLFVADVSAGSVTAYNVHVLCGHYSSGASTTIGGDLYVGYLRSQTRSTNSRSVTGHDSLLALENEAIEGSGMTMDSAIRIFDTNVTGDGFTYGIDFSGASIATADIKLSSGIEFPATQSASADANTLDDYEEGTYAPTITCSTSGSYGLHTSYDTAAYTKVGRTVHVQALLYVTSEDSPNGTLRLSLPFAVANLADGAGTSYVPIVIRNHGDGGIENAFLQPIEATSYASFANVTDAGVEEGIDHSRVDDDFLVGFTMTYLTD